MIRCKNCHKWFQPKDYRQVYCSIACRRVLQYIKRNDKKRNPIFKKKRCKFCLKWFRPKTKKSIFCSRKCNTNNAAKIWRITVKQRSLVYKGGKCQKCGYDKCVAALEFHHRNPKTKDNLGTGNRHAFSGRVWSKVKRELDKCDLLCANCHREVHSDISR